MTVYGLHALTGILGPAKRVTAFSGALVTEREFRGEVFPSDCDDNTLFLLDFGNALYAFSYGTAAGNLVTTFGTPAIFGTQGSIVAEKLNGEPLQYPGSDVAASKGQNAVLPDYNDRHSAEEFHVFQDILQLADLVRVGKPTPATPEHARHVIDIIESAYRSAETGQTQALRTALTR
jgi:predicted dehydrogenase